ncbi:putative F-box protein At1g55070 [Hevea brasiliensis]|uniref:putative F-box protein At1g55070 n=1 Tax=Hevea brasiliensis TaxID=3981 RepID=UPI0025EBF24C|nr:putative F-box protein At1g55070 [Hevea brasiliensis]
MDCYISKLPDDIVQRILCNLPTVALSQCRCVCKSWHNFLLDPDFAKLCLSREPSSSLLLFMENETLVSTKHTSAPLYPLELHRIVNPMMGKYITLPPCRNIREWCLDQCLLGFCPKTKRYKAICISSKDGDWEAYVHTIGTGVSWGSIGAVPFGGCHHNRVFSDAFVNGCCHWLVFRRIGYVSKRAEDDNLEIWVMKEYGVVESWAKLLVLENHMNFRSFSFLEVTKLLANGEVLLFDGHNLILYNPLSNNYRSLDIPGFRSAFDGRRHDFIVHNNPIFASLIDMLLGDNVKVGILF